MTGHVPILRKSGTCNQAGSREHGGGGHDKVGHYEVTHGVYNLSFL